MCARVFWWGLYLYVLIKLNAEIRNSCWCSIIRFFFLFVFLQFIESRYVSAIQLLVYFMNFFFSFLIMARSKSQVRNKCCMCAF